MNFGADFAAIAFGLLSAATWGAGDFSGGMATKRTNVMGVTVFAHATGLVFFVLLAILSNEPAPTTSDMAWALIAGCSGVFGLIAFYRGLAIGRMGIVAPVSAVITAGVPVIVGVLTQGLPTTIQLAGFVLAMIGVWLLSRPEDEQAGRPAGLGLALIAGLGFGGFLAMIHQVQPGHVYWPLAVARTGSVITTTVIALATQKSWVPSRSIVPLIILCGLLDAVGNTFFVLAGQAGRLDVASVLSSLYPASTVILANVVLKEKITQKQLVSIGFVLLAIVFIASQKG